MNQAVYIFLKFLSFSPLFNVSDDNYFGKLKRNSTSFRFSLISFNLGQRIFYFLSFKKLINTNGNNNNNSIFFDLFTVLKLQEVQNLPNLIEIDRKYDGYQQHLDNIDTNNHTVYKEALLYKITQVEAKKSKSFNKYLAYIAIIAFIIPLYASQFDKFYNLNNFYKVFFLIPLLYSFFNLLLFIYEVIRIETVNRAKFSFIRNSQDPLKAINLALYYDWLVSEDESVVQTSIIKNIEKYMIYIMLWSILLVISFNVVQFVRNDKMEENITDKNITKTSEIFYLDMSTNSQEFLKDNEQFFSKTKTALLENEVEKIILVKNEGAKNQQYSRILNFINTYAVNNIAIIEIEDNKNGQLQVIILKRSK